MGLDCIGDHGDRRLDEGRADGFFLCQVAASRKSSAGPTPDRRGLRGGSGSVPENGDLRGAVQWKYVALFAKELAWGGSPARTRPGYVPSHRCDAALAPAHFITARHLLLPTRHQSRRYSRRRPALECLKPDL
jgi:hypothetical protein